MFSAILHVQYHKYLLVNNIKCQTDNTDVTFLHSPDITQITITSIKMCLVMDEVYSVCAQ